MRLHIDGHCVEAQPGQTLLDLVRQLDLDDSLLSRRPLAAKIAGEVFTLNYIPLRKDHTQGDTLRRAMAASQGQVRLLTVRDSAGREVYTRTAQFVIFLALRRLWPNAKAKMDCTLGQGLYISVHNEPAFSVRRLRQEIQNIVDQDIPLLRRRVTTQQAMDYFRANGQQDKARLLSWRSVPYFDEYVYEDYADYFYGEMAPSTGYLSVWEIYPDADGFNFVFPDPQDPDSVADFRPMPHFFAAHQEGERWCRLMECETVADLNDLVSSGRIRELIRVNEALHERNFSRVADDICTRGAKIVMLAGPSSSGKTTSANRLATQLRVHGRHPLLISLDDYYMDRDKIPPGPDGKLDLEHINTIDVETFKRQMAALLQGESVELPRFNFKTGIQERSGHFIRLRSDSVLIVEGIHGLNPVLLPDGVDSSLIYRMYVTALLPLNLDYHNRIPTSYLRLLRRTVRDYETRGSSVQRTMEMWDSVRAGEERWIFPFQENADVIFNSSTLYELAVLKKHIFPLLTAVEPEDPCYQQVRGIVKVLNFICQADVDDEIPPTSLVREFIGGNTFYR